MKTIRMNIELDELQFVIDDLKDQLQEVKEQKTMIERKYERLISKIKEAKAKRKSTLHMTKEQEELIGIFRMEL
jgi:chromosome segregation ATPase